MHFTLRQLRVFEAVAQHLSYTRAAADLHLTQPAVSMQVKQLEEAVGLPLFEQLGKKIFLTEAGDELHGYSRKISQLLSEAGSVLDELKGVQRGRLKVSVVGTANYFVPELLAEFNRQYPGISINLNVTNRQELLHQLENNETDIVIMGQPPENRDLTSDIFRENPLVVVAAPGHPLAGERRIPLKKLETEIFLVREPGSGTRIAMERFFRTHQINIRTGMEACSNEAIKQSVHAGLGLGVLSRDTLAMELQLKRLAILNVEKFPIMRAWHIVHRTGKRLTSVTRVFKTFLMDPNIAAMNTSTSL